MPVIVRIDGDREVVWVGGTGEVTAADLAREAVGLLENPDYAPHMNALWDLRGMTLTGGIEALRALAELVSTPGVIQEKSRVALLVGPDRDYGLARLYQTRTEASPVEYRVFRDADEARGWIGVLDREPPLRSP